MGLSPKALAAVKKDLWKLFVAYAVGFRNAGTDSICKFDPFAAFVQEYHPDLFDYLELEDFQRWTLQQTEAATNG